MNVRCHECGTELSRCGEMTTDGPRMGCEVCQLRASLKDCTTALLNMTKHCQEISEENERLRAEIPEGEEIFETGDKEVVWKRFVGFTCPECGSHHFGTVALDMPKTEWTIHCHGYGCSFSGLHRDHIKS